MFKNLIAGEWVAGARVSRNINPSDVTDLTPSEVSAPFDRRTPLGLAYPSRLAWAPPMTLSDPRVIDSSPFYLRLQYKAVCEGHQGTAFCEVAYPHRLRWPLLGRMIEMSIHASGK